MSEAKILIKEIAEWVVADGRRDGIWSLSEFTSIKDVAAESLSKHQGELDLERLSKHAGPHVYLEGLTSLSDAAAEHLGRHEEGFSSTDCP